MEIKVGKRKIGENRPIFIVAEVSGNHNQNLERAKKIVEAACRAGVDAVKLQTYTPDTITLDCNNKYFQIPKSNKLWGDQTLYQLYKKAYTPWGWYQEIKKITDKYKVILFSTPFDETAVDFLEEMGTPLYKVASLEVTDTELLKKIAQTKKPVIISRGATSVSEIGAALNILKKNGAKEIAVLHCVSAYPARPEEMNLKTIPDIAKKFKVIAGLSDHSLGLAIPLAAVALGASIIEKHITLKRSDGGVDTDFSLEAEEFKNLVKAIREVEKALGRPNYATTKDEEKNKIFRRSLFIVKDLKGGDQFTADNVKSIRPGHGLSPRFFPAIIGKVAKRNIRPGTPLDWRLIK